MSAAHLIPAAARPAWRNLCAVLADLAEAGEATPCQGPHADWWVSDDPDEREAATWRCQPCPALTACAEYADVARERWHVFGGHDHTPTRGRPKEKAA